MCGWRPVSARCSRTARGSWSTLPLADRNSLRQWFFAITKLLPTSPGTLLDRDTPTTAHLRALCLFLGELTGEPQPSEELPTLIWLTPEQSCKPPARTSRLASCWLQGRRCCACRTATPPLRLVAPDRLAGSAGAQPGGFGNRIFPTASAIIIGLCPNKS